MRYMTILTCVANTKVAALDFSEVSFYGPRKKLTYLTISSLLHERNNDKDTLSVKNLKVGTTFLLQS